VGKVRTRVFQLLAGIASALGLVAALFCALCVTWLLAYWAIPEWVSEHRAFFRKCRSVPRGATVEEARAAMVGYLEVGRNWTPPPGMPAGIFGATIQGVAETRNEVETRLLFIPDAKNVADWCLLYPEKGRIVRVETSPD
jgi:hypothetical protein